MNNLSKINIDDIQPGYTLGHVDAAILREELRELLAYREAAGKPITLPEYMPYLNEETLANIVNYDQEGSIANAARMLACEVKFWHSKPLYAAPQLPAVPPELTKEKWHEIWDEKLEKGERVNDSFREGYEYCRQLMTNPGYFREIPETSTKHFRETRICQPTLR